MEIIELLTPAYEAAWLPWAVQYFFLIGICTTTALTAVACAFTGPHSKSARLLPALVVLLASSAVAAPVSLLADLHQPGRFWHFYAHFTPWSWMSLGAYLLPVFVTLSLAFCLLWWLGRSGWLRVVAVLLAFSALSILVYTGMEVMVVRSRPLWNTIFLPINFALTGWLATLGGILLVARWLPGGVKALPLPLLRRLGVVAVIALALCTSAWIVMGLMGHDQSFIAATRLFDSFPAWRMSFAGSVFTGAGIVVLLSRPPRVLGGSRYSLMAALVMMAAAWIFRWIVFMSVQGVPKYGAGLYLYSMPLGGDGLMGIVGVFGLWAALLAVLTYLLERYPTRTSRSYAPLAVAGN
ncbi:polysulfide reductase NrfD [Alcaligenaceae bacterium]|nr:polysulfide reductase NrfD [Alcaligenaceae bacterium]